ncbi:MAG: ATP-binding protein, partial [Bacteroidales bacterium]|nr:ATP-binding protein [Bacteroidales bacterium]
EFIDMILDPMIKESLQRILSEQRKYDQLIKHGLTPRRKLLLEGQPGCGKTMTAQALAGELGLSVFIVRLDGLISKFMGETISKLRIVFEAMKEYRAVYLFDEFDSIGSHRSQHNDVGEIRRVLNSFLINIEKDNSSSIIIAATNMPEALDKALYRRFDDIIKYSQPSQNEIISLIKHHLKGFKLANEMPIKEIAVLAQGLNYADIVRACDESKKEMIIGGKQVISESSISKFLQSRKRTT